MPLNSSASNKVGNGGNVVVCENDESRIQLLDLYEARDRTTLIKIDKYAEIGNHFISRMKLVSPKLEAVYAKRWSEFKEQVDWVEGAKLSEVKDSFHAIEPISDKCKVMQIAILQEVPLQKEKPFIIRLDLWKQMSELDQAGLVMHELLYQHFSRLGLTDSRKVRVINRMLLTQSFTTSEFWKTIAELKIPLYPES